ncbi:type ISP restriction/modification enzyme [Streptomyces zingiberis]|uniref:DNA methyltransferase n=1 Tax=Streptomyces zingiberis TaxID=2053010 RepID=A0ABX1C083_9ACTN|nr:type ISP restriction/modification enzyme [Streptomyces zingiberis]NJQ01357.1 DNA methyltransferase [Streptomyces zingiberis]
MGDDPLLADLLPWSVAPLRTGRSWVLAPEPATLTARWDRLTRLTPVTERAERERLFRPSRARNIRLALPHLPGHPATTGPLAEETGPCPEPVRLLHGPFDRQWLIPDQRLLDAARPELWRVADGHQLFAVETGAVPGPAGGGRSGHGGEGCVEDLLHFSALLPEGRSPAGRPGRIRPLFRRPGGAEPNLAPGLTALLTERLATPVTAEDVLAWTASAVRRHGGDRTVPLPRSAALWREGVALGRRVLWLHSFGARGAGGTGAPGERPRLPGGRRPYVRAALPENLGALPPEPLYDAAERALLLGEGRIAPVEPAAWEFEVSGVPVLAEWYARRVAPADPGTLAAIGPARWPRDRTSELLELITVLTLLDELRPERRRLAQRLAGLRPEERLTTAELRGAGVLPVPAAARRPASVLDHPEEGPGGQFALL